MVNLYLFPLPGFNLLWLIHSEITTKKKKKKKPVSIKPYSLNRLEPLPAFPGNMYFRQLSG